MKTLIVGAGALGGLIAARMIAAGAEVWLATRGAPSTARLRVRGVGGDVDVVAPHIAPLASYDTERFELAVLATKAADAMELAPRVSAFADLVMPIQNGAVAELLTSRLGAERVLGAISNLGATMHAPGDYEQRNAGHLLLDGAHARSASAAAWLGRGPTIRTTQSFRGAVWSKLLLNCAVTSIGAVVGEPMRAYITRPEARDLFERAYAEALAVAHASGVTPERMLVDPIPSADYEAWLATVLASYGDLKPSMLQDFERGRPTEVDFINGFIAAEGARLGVPTPANAAITRIAHAIERGELAPSPELVA